MSPINSCGAKWDTDLNRSTTVAACKRKMGEQQTHCITDVFSTQDIIFIILFTLDNVEILKVENQQKFYEKLKNIKIIKGSHKCTYEHKPTF